MSISALLERTQTKFSTKVGAKLQLAAEPVHRPHVLGICIAAHGEGELLGKTYQNIAGNIQKLRSALRASEQPAIVIAIGLDCAGDPTVQANANAVSFLSEAIQGLPEPSCRTVFSLSYGDVALTRNWLNEYVIKLGAECVVNYDGDDLYPADELYRLYATWLERQQHEIRPEAIIVPEYMFELRDGAPVEKSFSAMQRYRSSTDDRLSLTWLYDTNLWQSHMLVDSRILRYVKYRPREDSFKAVGYTFLLDAVGLGYDVIVAPGAIRVRRIKREGSLSRAETFSTRVLAPNYAFKPRVFVELRHSLETGYVDPDKVTLCQDVTNGSEKIAWELQPLSAIEPEIPETLSVQQVELTPVKPSPMHLPSRVYMDICLRHVYGMEVDLRNYHLSAQNFSELVTRIRLNWENPNIVRF